MSPLMISKEIIIHLVVFYSSYTTPACHPSTVFIYLLRNDTFSHIKMNAIILSDYSKCKAFYFPSVRQVCR